MSETPSVPARHQYEAFLQQLPSEWDQMEITQVGVVVGGGTPSRVVPSYWRGPIPWVTPGEVSGEAAKLLHDTNEHISPSGLAGSGANLLPAGSLLVTTRATLGARVINAVPMATNQGFKSIVFKKPEEDIEEQQRLEVSLEASEVRIKQEKLTLQKLRSEKVGLMDDLLTGRVRVTPLLAEAAQQQGSA